MNIDILAKSDLQSFRQELINEMQTIVGNSSKTEQKWLKGIDVRKLLNIFPGTLQNLRINGSLKPSKVGGTLFYKRSDIETLLEEGE